MLTSWHKIKDAWSTQVASLTSMEELRQRSLLLTGYLEFLINCALPAEKSTPDHGVVTCEIITPRDSAHRGCQLSLKFNCDIRNMYAELVKRGVAVS